MSDRIQINVRLDKYPDLYDAIKERVEEEGVTLNNFAIRAFQQALGWGAEFASPVVRHSQLEEILAPMRQELEELKRQLGKSRA